MTTLNPFEMRAEIRLLEDRVWTRRKEFYEKEEREALALTGGPPLRCEPPVRASQPTNKKQAVMVS